MTNCDHANVDGQEKGIGREEGSLFSSHRETRTLIMREKGRSQIRSGSLTAIESLSFHHPHASFFKMMMKCTMKSQPSLLDSRREVNKSNPHLLSGLLVDSQLNF